MATIRAAAGVIAALALCGCASREPVRVIETQEVRVPVYVRAEPPADLMAAEPAELPEFIPPADPSASSALTPDGEKRLRLLIHDLNTALRAWRAWAKSSQ